MRDERHLNGSAKSQNTAHPEKAPFPDGSGSGLRVGYPDGGICGPTTASVGGPTCAGRDWPYEIVTHGAATVAIFPAQEAGGLNVARRNAHLFVAASDMFEALKAAKAFHDRDSGLNGFTAEYEIVRAQIDAALSKATGGQHV